MPQSTTLEPGDLVGPFRIVRPLGAGGMGEVYLAIHKKDYRNVALKVIRANAPDAATALEWFRREAAIYRSIAHPNVVNFIDEGEDRGLHYVALEHIVGPSLRQWLNRNGKADVRLAFSWSQDLAFALHAAHQRDVIHRDIKPENIMVAANKTIKLIDFGLARPEGTPSPEERPASERLIRRGRPRDGRLTGSSGLVGTLSYLAPECLFGHPADHRSDIYSLGLVFYELLTGQIAIQEVSDPSTIFSRHGQIDGLTAFLPRPASPLARELEAFVLRMLRADPAKRFASTKAMVEAMQVIAKLFAAELDGDSLVAGKRRAQQELVDTHYWQAANLFAEKRVVEAIDELYEIVTFASSLTAGPRDTIAGQLDRLFYGLRLLGGESDGSDPYCLDRALQVEVLEKVLELYRAVAPADTIRLRTRAFVRRLEKLLPPDEFGKRIQTLLPHHMGDPAITRAFVSSLARQNLVVARDVALKFIRELMLKGNLILARSELNELEATFDLDESTRECASDLSILELHCAEEESAVITLLDAISGTRAADRARKICKSYLTKHPDSLPVLHRLAEACRAANRQRDLPRAQARIGAVSYWKGDIQSARRAFVETLEHDERNLTAIAYLCDILHQEGRLGRMPHDERAFHQRMYEALGLYGIARRELENQLSGTARDEPILVRLGEAAHEKRPI